MREYKRYFNKVTLLIILLLIVISLCYYLFSSRLEVTVMGKNIYFSRFQTTQKVVLPNGISHINIVTNSPCQLSGSSGTSFYLSTSSDAVLYKGSGKFKLHFIFQNSLISPFQYSNSEFELLTAVMGSKHDLMLIGSNRQNSLEIYEYQEGKITEIPLSNAPFSFTKVSACISKGKLFIAYDSAQDKKVYLARLDKGRLTTLQTFSSEFVSSLSLCSIKNGVALSICDSMNDFKNQVYQIYPKKRVDISTPIQNTCVSNVLLSTQKGVYQCGVLEKLGYGISALSFQDGNWRTFGRSVETQVENLNLVAYQNGLVALFSKSNGINAYQISQDGSVELGKNIENAQISTNALILLDNTLRYYYKDKESGNISENIWDGKNWEKSDIFSSNFLNKYGTILAISDGNKRGYFVLFKEGTYIIYKIQ